MKTNLLLIIMCFILFSCKEENDTQILSELDLFFISFEEEAFERGIDIDIDQLDVSASIENIDNGNVIGQCSSFSDGSRVIVLDENFWEDSSEREKEFLVFHELGHCVLGKDHNDAQNNAGVCISIMQSGTSGCRRVYNNNNREALLDELFEL